ncbi:MAG: glutamate 5-kinase [Candidatus Gastranaerophilales bacterium]|nr:glutamate 5-kinase [Candidatus Gastranaerophilales bacterium]
MKINDAKRIVFKFGTNVLRNENREISLSRIYSFIEEISKLHRQGKEIIIVTSGAVGLGAKRLDVNSSESLSIKQACAAVGQCQLMSIYEDGFNKYSVNTAQILLTEDDFTNRVKYLSLNNVLNTLLELKVIPVINQNDTVSTSELEGTDNPVYGVSFSDNDKLSALVASKLDADLLVILSDIDGLYDDNPKENANAHLISEVKELTEEIERYAQSASKGGRGGMRTKLQAAKVVTHSGGYVIIANGKSPQIITRLFSEEKTGTVFYPVEQLSQKRRWIAYATNITGQIIVNLGAKKAVVEENKSLLPIGVLKINGCFDCGDVVSILDENKNEFARGIANYNSIDCSKIAGKHSDNIYEILGHKNYDAIITKDNIALL